MKLYISKVAATRSSKIMQLIHEWISLKEINTLAVIQRDSNGIENVSHNLTVVSIQLVPFQSFHC